MPGTSSNKEGDADTFYAPAFPGHRGNFGGGKPPPTTMPKMRNSVTLACVERKAPFHLTVFQGGGAEEKAVSGGGIEGEIGEGLSGIWITFGKRDGVQVYGKGDDSR